MAYVGSGFSVKEIEKEYGDRLVEIELIEEAITRVIESEIYQESKYKDGDVREGSMAWQVFVATPCFYTIIFDLLVS